jgi:hypothetical protein
MTHLTERARRQRWVGALLIALAVVAVTVGGYLYLVRPWALSNLPDTWDGVHFASIFDTHASTDEGVDYVWAARPYPGERWHELYDAWQSEGWDPFGCNPDEPCDPEYSLSWFQEHHPDWVMYKKDGKTPATPNADQTRMPILDTTNPDVQKWIIDRENDYLSHAEYGYGGISYDDSITWNISSAVGHYTTDGEWVHQYSGTEYYDPVYAQAQAEAFAEVVAGVKAAHPQATATINQGYICDDANTKWSDVTNTADMVLDEYGFTFGARKESPYITSADSQQGCSNWWLSQMTAYQRLQKDMGKGLVLVSQEPYIVTSYITDTDPQARFDLQWCLANYLLIKYHHTYFWWGTVGTYGSGPSEQHEFEVAAQIGSPTGDFYASQDVYMRNFSNGLAIVNPSADTYYTITLDEGRYRDLYGSPVHEYAMPPHSGLILLKAP